MRDARTTWGADKLPDHYPSCKRKDLVDAIQDLSSELITRSLKDDKDFVNRGWKERLVAFINVGTSELQRRNSNHALCTTVIGVIIALIALYLSF